MPDKETLIEKMHWETFGPIKIYRPWCKNCGICVEFCPKDVLALGEDGKVVVQDVDSCTECGLCEIRCPDFAIIIEK
jgi:2-oxoglutarate ferredoxin oxidoreductase subunit delta